MKIVRGTKTDAAGTAQQPQLANTLNEASLVGAETEEVVPHYKVTSPSDSVGTEPVEAEVPTDRPARVYADGNIPAST